MTKPSKEMTPPMEIAPVSIFEQTANHFVSSSHLFFNRELSWLEFNRRVLEEAQDPTNPLLERLKFLAIFSTNLDEFFMIRVSGLMEKMEDEILELSPDGMTPADELREVSLRVRPMLEAQIRCLLDEVLPGLAQHGITLLQFHDLNASEKKRANQYFRDKVFPMVTPQAVDPSHPFPFISNLSLNLGVHVEPDLKEDGSIQGKNGLRFARVKLPPTVPRLIPVDEAGTKFTFLGSLIAANADALFPNMKCGKFYNFRVTRDADIEIREDEAGDLLHTLKQHLRGRRRFGWPVRLEVAENMPPEMVEYLMKSFDLSAEDVYRINGPLNIPDLMSLYSLDKPELKDPPLQVSVPAPLRQKKNIFDIIRQQDILLHHPYTSFSTVTDFIAKAASDPQVVAIKTCLYRTGRHSPIVQSLMEASEQGKQVAVLVELKARFDEENNIEWARQLEKAGVHVVYGLMGLKTHCKLALVIRREGEVLKRYVHISTGNYNPATSKIYTDIGLFTANEEISADATHLFNYLTGYSRFSNYQRLLVAPINLRESLMRMIEREAANARSGKAARIVAKFNSLTDTDMIETLYAASQSGVEIDLIVRGVCILKPGLPGVSDNIRVRSIVGRFLEHSRIFYFANDGNEELYIGSADWMGRNLDRRVEVVTPVLDPQLKKHLKDVVLAAYMQDNIKARELQNDGSYARAPRTEADPRRDSQLLFQNV